MKSVLFPISVSTEAFSSETVVGSLQAFKWKPQEVYFLVADELQLYNWIASDSASKIGPTLRRFYEGNRYTIERAKWVEKLKRQVGFLQTAHTVGCFGTTHFVDKEYVRIHRNICILFEMDDLFRRDIQQSALSFVASRGQVAPLSEKARRLSVAYALEEIAVNLRVRVSAGIEAECYQGKFLKSLVKLYYGLYDVNVWDLCSCKPSKVLFSFFSIANSNAGPRWVKVASTSDALKAHCY